MAYLPQGCLILLPDSETANLQALLPVRRSNSVGYGKENQLFVKDNERPGVKSVTRPVKQLPLQNFLHATASRCQTHSNPMISVLLPRALLKIT